MQVVWISLLIIVVSALVAFAILSVVTWLVYVPLLVRNFTRTPRLVAPSGASLPHGEDCQFATSGGLVLRGTYLHTMAAPRRGVILFCHELTGDRWNCCDYVEGLLETGFDVFAFDFRNHGTSDRQANYEPMPWITQYELDDALAAVAYVCDRPDADPRGVGLFGISKGGTAALCAAAQDARVRAVVTDGAFPIYGMQLHYIRRFHHIYSRFAFLSSCVPDVCLFSYCAWCQYFVARTRHCRFLNVEQLVQGIKQQVFMIHGQADPFVPLSVVQELRASIPGRCKLWLVPGAKHNGSILAARDLYRRRVARFFSRYVRARREPVEPCPQPPADVPLSAAAADKGTIG